ncbi:hypothetical protein BDN72DRAFT_857825 [Pluteus cervinus]|uniref:Uncharacterized protein n=1 Tax=Pluteus cervinus TaxID=181527 RepID=A0ACD3AU37_9AGAR|nr:hypothetical protein BDN72DRAFT_857825 [Pluteus cervinus]
MALPSPSLSLKSVVVAAVNNSCRLVFPIVTLTQPGLHCYTIDRARPSQPPPRPSASVLKGDPTESLFNQCACTRGSRRPEWGSGTDQEVQNIVTGTNTNKRWSSPWKGLKKATARGSTSLRGEPGELVWRTKLARDQHSGTPMKSNPTLWTLTSKISKPISCMTVLIKTFDINLDPSLVVVIDLSRRPLETFAIEQSANEFCHSRTYCDRNMVHTYLKNYDIGVCVFNLNGSTRTHQKARRKHWWKIFWLKLGPVDRQEHFIPSPNEPNTSDKIRQFLAYGPFNAGSIGACPPELPNPRLHPLPARGFVTSARAPSDYDPIADGMLASDVKKVYLSQGELGGASAGNDEFSLGDEVGKMFLAVESK